MSDKAETAAIRLWRDRAHLREHERDDAQARAKIAEEKVAILAVENNRLADEIARLRALLNPDAAQARAETEQQMQVLKTALLALLDQSQPAHSRSATSAWPAFAVNPCRTALRAAQQPRFIHVGQRQPLDCAWRVRECLKIREATPA